MRVFLLAAAAALVAPIAARSQPAPVPVVLGAGVLSGPADDADPAFTPDGDTVYFARGGAIVVAHRLAHASDRWSTPVIASFSGEWSDQQPTMSPDGTSLVFVSNRPVHAGDATHPGGNLWRVDRGRGGWSAPVRLPASVNADNSTWAPSVTGDGSVYFIRRAGRGAPFRLWRSQRHGDAYDAAVPVSFGDSTTQDVDPAIAPDESFLVFGSMHPNAPDAHERLFLALRNGTGWGHPIDLGDVVNDAGDTNEARLGADRRSVCFSSARTVRAQFPRTRAAAEIDLTRAAAWNNGSLNIWCVSLAPWLATRR